jgi:hypothetical protein
LPAPAPAARFRCQWRSPVYGFSPPCQTDRFEVSVGVLHRPLNFFAGGFTVSPSVPQFGLVYQFSYRSCAKQSRYRIDLPQPINGRR